MVLRKEQKIPYLTRESLSLAGDGNICNDASMEARIVQLETIIPTLATKADVESLRLT